MNVLSESRSCPFPNPDQASSSITAFSVHSQTLPFQDATVSLTWPLSSESLFSFSEISVEMHADVTSFVSSSERFLSSRSGSSLSDVVARLSTIVDEDESQSRSLTGGKPISKSVMRATATSYYSRVAERNSTSEFLMSTLLVVMVSSTHEESHLDLSRRSVDKSEMTSSKSNRFQSVGVVKEEKSIRRKSLWVGYIAGICALVITGFGMYLRMISLEMRLHDQTKAQVKENDMTLTG
jgi:hypothetical protein